MNGKPPATAAPQIPPSVQHARQHPSRSGKRGWTGLWRARIVWALVGLAVVAMIVAKVVATMQAKTPTKTATESTMDPYWGRQTFQYKTEDPPVPPEEKKPVDTTAPELAAVRRQMTRDPAGVGGTEKPQDDDGDQAGEHRGTAGRPRADAVHFAHGPERR